MHVEKPKLISDASTIADEKLAAMVEQRNNLLAQQKLLEVRELAVLKKLEALAETMQAYCKHELHEQTSSYFSGSYDEQACSYYRITCNVCAKVLKTWEKGHGHYG